MYRPNTPSRIGLSYILTMLQQACCVLTHNSLKHFRHARCAVTTGIGIGQGLKYRYQSNPSSFLNCRHKKNHVGKIVPYWEHSEVQSDIVTAVRTFLCISKK